MKLRLLNAILMSLVLSGLMSGWVTFINLGLTADYLEKWGDAFRLAWPAAAVIAFLFAPRILKISQWILQRTGDLPQPQKEPSNELATYQHP